MAESKRVHCPPKTAVLYLYDPNGEAPLPVEPAPGGLLVILPSSSENLDEIKAFFGRAAAELGLALPKGVS